VEASDAGDEAGLAGIEPGQLHGPFNGVGAVGDEEAVLEVARGQLTQQAGERPPQRVEQLLRAERHPLELRLHRPHDLGMVDPGRVDPVAAEAVDEPPAGDVLEVAALARPLDRGVFAALRHRLAILEEAAVVVVTEVVDGLADDLPPLVVVELVRVDDAQPTAALVDELLA